MHNLSAHQIRTLFTSGELSAEEITEKTLQRIDRHDGSLQAFLHVFNDRARKKARALDLKRKNNQPLGKLAGVPIALKDLIHVKGEITTCASKILQNYRAVFDATVVRFLEEEDAILIGKTNMDEFAMGASGTHSAFFPTKNPWNLACSPGGSSSGSAAAVSARLCPIAIGSDTGGSIRQPAAFTGIVGFKPTYGRISRYGAVAFASSFDQLGPFARSTKDIALLMEVLGRPCARDAMSIQTPPPDYAHEMKKSIQNTKIGVPWSFLETLNGESRQNFDQTIEVFKSLGAQIVDVDLSILKYGIAVYYILTSAEASTNLARFDGIRYGIRSKTAKTLEEIYDYSRSEGFGSEVKNRILLGTFVLSGGYHDAYYTKAQKVRTLIIKKMREAFGKCSMIALPTSPGTAFPLHGIQNPLEEYLQDLYTVGAPLAGLPAISIPSGLSQEKKPFGLQLVGAQMHDAQVLAYAQAFESATSFAQAIPPGFGDDL